MLGEESRERRAADGPERAAGRDQPEEAVRLLAREAAGQGPPGDRDDQEVDDAGPDEEGPGRPCLTGRRQGLEGDEEGGEDELECPEDGVERFRPGWRIMADSRGAATSIAARVPPNRVGKCEVPPAIPISSLSGRIR